MNKGMLAFIGMILALVFIIIGLIGPWYSISFMGFSIEAGLFTESMTGMDRGPWDTTMYIAIIAFILAIIGLIGALGVLFNFGNAATMSKLGGICGLLAGIFALIAAIYFMTSSFLEGMGDVGFWNEFGGPGYGWYLMLLGGIIAIIFSLPMFKKQAA